MPPVQLHNPLHLDKKHTVELTLFSQFQQKKTEKYNIVRVEFMGMLLYSIAFDCTGVTNKVTTECILWFAASSVYTTFEKRLYFSYCFIKI